MSLHIILLIFGEIYESFRDTWISDDFGIFRIVFRIFDLNLETCLFNILNFSSQRKYFPFYNSSLFPLLYFPLLPSQTTWFSQFSKIPFLQISKESHSLPLNSFLITTHSLSLPWPAKWPGEGHLTLSFLAKTPLSSILIPLPLQNPNPI